MLQNALYVNSHDNLQWLDYKRVDDHETHALYQLALFSLAGTLLTESLFSTEQSIELLVLAFFLASQSDLLMPESPSSFVGIFS